MLTIVIMNIIDGISIVATFIATILCDTISSRAVASFSQRHSKPRDSSERITGPIISRFIPQFVRWEVILSN